MNTKKLLGAALCSLVALGGFAQQPFGGCWHPQYVESWTPEADPDAKFNRSLVKLRPRIADDGIKANEYQYPDAKIAACLTMNPMCSTTPSQGANNFIGYNPTYWQYMDMIVWWGGSAGEGIIVPPTAPVVDVCHMNGVKVLGNVFFPPSAYSGDPEWVRQFLKEENGVYPIAKKMYEIAKFYGFDGWFLNEETYASTQSQWEGWISYFYECAHADGNYDMELQWYDANYYASGIMPLLAIDDNVSYMANYGSASATGISGNWSTFQSAGKTREEFFKQLYSGLEMAQGGLTGNANYFQPALPKTGHASSLQLFNPEEHIWKQVVEDILDTEDNCGRVAYDAIEEVFANESRVWVNLQGDPSNTASRDNASTWPGLANAIQERSTIQDKPFVTCFSAGQGKYRFVEGEKQATQDWYHRGMQSILPTWRWWVESSANDNLVINYNWDDAYNVGTSVSISGRISANADHILRLYKTHMAIEQGDKFQLIYKSSTPGSINLKLGVVEDGNAFTDFTLRSAGTVNGWIVAEADLSSLAGKTVSIIALNIKAAASLSNYTASLGQLGIIPSSYSESLQVSNLEVQNELGEEEADLRIVWDAPADYDNVDHFDVYVERNGVKTLVGQTRDEAFYVPKFVREDDENSLVVSVVTVTKDMKQGEEVSITKNYPAMTAPEVSVMASKTLVTPGEQVTFTATANMKPKTYEWTAPAGAKLISQNGNTAVMQFDEEGLYSISVKVGNDVGTTNKTEANLVEVSSDKTLDNVAEGKTIHSVSGEIAASGEVATNIIDGRYSGLSVHQKWCVGGSKEHWVIIDLEQPYQLYWFKIYDASTNEAGTDNLNCYRIELSNDLNSWTEVIDATGRGDENIHEDWIKPTVARYVRFVPYDEDAPITIRIWEFQAYGAESPLSIDAVEPQSMQTNSTLKVSGTFDFGESQRSDNFAITAVSDNEDVLTVADVTSDADAGTYELTLESAGLANVANVTVTFVNESYMVYTTFAVNVTDPTMQNLISGRIPTLTDSDTGLGAPADRGDVANVTDGNYESFFAPSYGDGSMAARFEYDLGGLKELSSLVLRLDYNDGTATDYSIPVAVSVEVSADGSSFTKLTDLDPAKEIRYNVTDASRASKVALCVTPGLFTSTKVVEFEVYGKDATGQGVDDTVAGGLTVAPSVVNAGEDVTVAGTALQSVKVYSMQGALVKTVAADGQYSVAVGTDGLASGIYLMLVEGEGYAETVKFVVR